MSAEHSRGQKVVNVSVLVICFLNVTLTGEVVLPALAALFAGLAMLDWRRGIRPHQRLRGPFV